jgi:hypothetical protein
MPKIFRHNRANYLVSAICCTLALVACGIDDDPTPPPPVCLSIQLGDDLATTPLGTTLRSLSLPADRQQNGGWASVILPTASTEARVFFGVRNAAGQWSLAERQVVARVQPGDLDLSPMLRLVYNTDQQFMVLFILIPATQLNRRVDLQPMLAPNNARYGRLQTFRARPTTQGYLHPFQGIDQGISGEAIPPHLANTLNALAPGSIYIPEPYHHHFQLAKANSSDPNLCPLAGSP